MPAPKPEYEALPEFSEIATKLVQRYPEKFDGVNVNLIRAVQITNKDPKEGKHVWEITPVPYPMRLDLQYDYYVTLYGKEWAASSKKRRAAIVADALHGVSHEGDGKVVPMDMKDYGDILRTLGVDWQFRDDIPDLLGDKAVRWITAEDVIDTKVAQDA